MATRGKSGGKGKGSVPEGFKAAKVYDRDAVKAGQRVGQQGDEDDGFDQGGPDGPAKQRAAGAKEPKKGENFKEFTDEERAEQVAELLEKVDEVDALVAANNREAAAKNQPHRKKLANAIKVLVKDGVISSSVMSKVIQVHRAERKLETADATLNDEQKNEYQATMRGLKGLVGTPLGDAAIQAAERAHTH